MIKTDEQIQKSLDLLGKRPDLKKFQKSSQAVKDMESCYSSQIYGGSTFLPIGSGEKKSSRRDKENTLEADIKACNVDYLYGGGYYTLKFVQIDDEYDKGLLVDCYMLIDSIDDLEDMKSLKLDVEKSENMKPNSKGFKQLNYKDIQAALNGYGRLIFYKTTNQGSLTPSDLEIMKVQEGKFKNGLMDGYCRSFDLKAGNEKVEVGFMKEGKPMGKYQSFLLDGTPVEEGIKEGEELIKKINIANY